MQSIEVCEIKHKNDKLRKRLAEIQKKEESNKLDKSSEESPEIKKLFSSSTICDNNSRMDIEELLKSFVEEKEVVPKPEFQKTEYNFKKRRLN